MHRFAHALHRLLVAIPLGAQVCLAALVAPVVFSPAIAALPHGHPRRELAAEQVGAILAGLDRLTIVACGAAALLAILHRSRWVNARRAALFPLLAGFCAAASLVGVTPAIRALREAGQVGTPRFGQFHALSSSLLMCEILLLVWTLLSTDLDSRRAAQ